MTGTGFIKCIPITLFGFLVKDAIFVIEIEEVFEAKIVLFFLNFFKSFTSGPVIKSNLENKSCLTFKFSVTALKI